MHLDVMQLGISTMSNEKTWRGTFPTSKGQYCTGLQTCILPSGSIEQALPYFLHIGYGTVQIGSIVDDMAAVALECYGILMTERPTIAVCNEVAFI